MHTGLSNGRERPVSLVHVSLGQRIKRLRDALPLTSTRSVSKLVPIVTSILPFNDLTLLLLLFLSLDAAVTLLLYDDTFNSEPKFDFVTSLPFRWPDSTLRHSDGSRTTIAEAKS